MERYQDDVERSSGNNGTMGNSNRRGGYGPIPEAGNNSISSPGGNDDEGDEGDPMDVTVELDRSILTVTDQFAYQNKILLKLAVFLLGISMVVFFTYQTSVSHSSGLPSVSAEPSQDSNSTGGGTLSGHPWSSDREFDGIFASPRFGSSEGNVGYLTQPDVYNDTLVFVSEGDVYATNIANYQPSRSFNAARITSTQGNVLTPKVRKYLVAYTATYSGVRDVYVADLRGNTPALRVTYFDSTYGAIHVIQWLSDDEVMFSAFSNEVGMEDMRLYKVKISGENIGAVTPIELAQATDAAQVVQDDNMCTYFVRYKQSSNTIRYVGGTAENIWVYCEGDDKSTKISGSYNGTSRAPRFASFGQNENYLLFLSDRSDGSNGPTPVITNLFAMSLDDRLSKVDKPFAKLTNVCDGIGVADLAFDDIQGNVVLRVGADLFFLKKDHIVNQHLIDIESLAPIRINVRSDFNNLQERIIPVNLLRHMTSVDVINTQYGQINSLLTLRGQLFSVPTISDASSPYQSRRRKVGPGSRMGGFTRILWSGYVTPDLVLALATDHSNMGSHAWYLLETSGPSFSVAEPEPIPILTNITSVYVEMIAFCNLLVAWTDTDGDVHVMDLQGVVNGTVLHSVLPKVNNLGSPVAAIYGLELHVNGDLLAITHAAKNSFVIVTLAKLTKSDGGIEVDMVQATSDNYNSVDVFLSEDTMYFFSDQDIVNDVSSPWGTRAPMPHFEKPLSVYALPLTSNPDLMVTIPELNKNFAEENSEGTELVETSPLVFELSNLVQRSYRLSFIPSGNHFKILTANLGLILLGTVQGGNAMIIAWFEKIPGSLPIEVPIVSLDGVEYAGVTNNRAYFYLINNDKLFVYENSLEEVMQLSEGIQPYYAHTANLALHIQPQLEYMQMYTDAWRLLRDYFYDKNMHGVDWPNIYYRYLPLVKRCAKREDLDDVLRYMSSELSALHVFVYGGEYNSAIPNIDGSESLHRIGSLGASVSRTSEGYQITKVFIPNPDFDNINGHEIVSPLSDKTLSVTGQKGLVEGDIITHINGEHVLSAPSLGYFLRGSAGESILLQVLRSGANEEENLIVVPIDQDAAADLRYRAWEYKTKVLAEQKAKEIGFTVGYTHLRAMGRSDINDFARTFYPYHNADALVIDVRHNHGGNIDSWLLDTLSRKAWVFFQGRATNITDGGLGWGEQMSFRGKVVILIDEKTSSDAESFSRGMKTLGLGTLIGTRTWGGGIWLSSDNHLVDGGIATAPEVGTYNNEWGWGTGIEQMGVIPDIIVDNEPYSAYHGVDKQLEEAILFLAEKLGNKTLALPKNPGPHPNRSITSFGAQCSA